MTTHGEWLATVDMACGWVEMSGRGGRRRLAMIKWVLCTETVSVVVRTVAAVMLTVETMDHG